MKTMERKLLLKIPNQNESILWRCWSTILVLMIGLSSYNLQAQETTPEAGEIVGGPFEFCVDGTEDMVYGLSLTGDAVGSLSTWVITDDQGKILGLPPTLDAVEGVNFDGAGAGTCLIWYLRYEEGLEGLAPDLNANDLYGSFDLSNPVAVVRNYTEGGTLTGGPYYFTVDGTPDMVSGISLTGERSGTNSIWMITDEDGKILGLPPSLDAVKGVNFDGAGVGTCFIYHLRYEDGIVGLEADGNRDDLEGCFDLSNAVMVVRSVENNCDVNGGEITGGPFEFTVGDDVADMLEEDAVTLTNSQGTHSQWVITDEEGNILGLPPTPSAVDFDGAGEGTCLIWHLSFEDGLIGAEVGLNANDLEGCYSLSNAIEVIRSASTSGKIGATPFPIPAVNTINVSLSSFNSDNVIVTMVDLAGNSVKSTSKKVVDDAISLDVQSVPSGLYILNIRNSNGQSVTKKVIVQ